MPYKTLKQLLRCLGGVEFKSFATYQGGFQMHAEISTSSGVEFLLEVFVLWVIGRPISYDENGLNLGGMGQKTDIKKD